MALLPRGPRGYSLVDPRAPDDATPVTERVAAILDGSGFVFYRNLPERTLRPRDLLVFGLLTTARDLRTVLGVGMLVGLLGTITPIATGLLINSIIPAS